MFDVTALGELLVDFTPAGRSDQGNPLFERNPGGAPANVLACLARLGRRAAFLGKVGDDPFGAYLVGVLRAQGIDTGGVRKSRHARTTLAFVELDGKGDPEFSFYRNPGADAELEPDEVDETRIAAARVFHFGSISLTREPARSATLRALALAREHRLTVSCDPNLRPALWDDLAQARHWITAALRQADIVKISGDELEFLTGEPDPERGSDILRERLGIPLIWVTLGERGCFYRCGDRVGARPAFQGLRIVDTTGAGDAFLGGALHSMLAHGWTLPAEIDAEALPQMADFACAAAGLCATRKGAIPAMPSLPEVEGLLRRP